MSSEITIGMIIIEGQTLRLYPSGGAYDDTSVLSADDPRGKELVDAIAALPALHAGLRDEQSPSREKAMLLARLAEIDPGAAQAARDASTAESPEKSTAPQGFAQPIQSRGL